MTVHLSQLPRHVRQRLAGRLAELPAARRRALVAGSPSTFTCETPGCGEVFRAWAPAQRHANTLGHWRIRTLGGSSCIVDVGAE